MKRLMYRAISLFLLFSVMISAFSVLVFAGDFSEAIDVQESELLSENILSFSCIYDPNTKNVNINGTMNHDAFALHGDSMLLIYSIPAGKSENDVIYDKSYSPIAESPVSISFAFSFKIDSIVERYCRYAIFIRSTDGKYILTTEAQYAETNIAFEETVDKSAFKGLSGNYSSSISSLNSQVTVIPVYLDLIFADDASGHIYQVNDYQIAFNENYIDELDAEIRSLSMFNTTVYLQFLLRSGGIIPTFMNDGAEYALPNTFDEQTIMHIHAVTDFLISRYSGRENGYVSGIVLGKAWDNPSKFNSYKDVSFDSYVLMCGNYAAVVSNAARDINPKTNIILSFSADGFCIEQNENENINNYFSSRKLLSALMEYFDESSYSGIKCSLLLEAYETPLDITSDDIKNGIDTEKDLPNGKFYIGGQSEISDFLAELSTKYKSATKYYTVLWIPKKELKGNALCAAYAYAYYELLTDNNVLGFNVEFSSKAENLENLSDLAFVLKNIDSSSSGEATEDLLAFFGKDTWLEVVNAKEFPKSTQKKYYYSSVLSNLPKKIKGEFCYFDFSKAFLADGWIRGAGCDDIKIDYLLTGDKALKANMRVGDGDFCDLIYKYEYSENISYTPYIKFNIEINSERAFPLYEIKFVFNSQSATFESSTVIKGNSQAEVILDMSKAKSFSLLDSVKISLRSLDGSVDNASLFIRDITGYSKNFSNQELGDFIEKERDKQKYHNLDSEYSVWFKIGFVALIISLSAALGFLFILFIRKNSRRKE